MPPIARHMPTIGQLGAWLSRAAAFPLACDGMSQVTSTLLQREGISHSVCAGELTVDGVGSMWDHWWVELGWQYPGYLIDYRAIVWLGKVPEVPHGVFVPTMHQLYRARKVLALTNHAIYERLTGEPLSAYPPL